MDGAIAGLVLVGVLVVFAAIIVAKSVALIPQAEAAVIERLGRYSKTVSGQLTLAAAVRRQDPRAGRSARASGVVPAAAGDHRGQPDGQHRYRRLLPGDRPAAKAVYQISNYIVGVEQLTTTTLRNVVGGMTLEQTLTSRDQINGQLRGVLDEATGRWGLRVARVELRSIDPPPSIQESMEKQMRADREKRAMILTAEGTREASIKQAEGQKQAQILSAEGAKQAAILAAEADRQSRMLRAQGERAASYLQAQGQAKAIEKTFAAIKAGRPTPRCWPTSTCRRLPQMAKGEANKVWLVPSDFGSALQGFTRMLGAPGEDGVFRYTPSPVEEDLPKPEDDSAEVAEWFNTQTDPAIAQAVAKAEADARGPSGISALPPLPETRCRRRNTPRCHSSGSAGPPPPPPPPPGRHSIRRALSRHRRLGDGGLVGEALAVVAAVRADLVDQACDAHARGAERDQNQQRADMAGERIAEDDHGRGARQQTDQRRERVGQYPTDDAPAA